jgi:hypothetical protein
VIDLNDALEHPLSEARSTAATPPHRSTKGHVRSTVGSRVCADGTCSTVLSRYNDTGACWVHSPAQRTSPGPRP